MARPRKGERLIPTMTALPAATHALLCRVAHDKDMPLSQLLRALIMRRATGFDNEKPVSSETSRTL